MTQRPMTSEEIDAFYQLRKAEGLLIDPVTAEINYWWEYIADRYDLGLDLCEEARHGKVMWFARRPEGGP